MSDCELTLILPGLLARHRGDYATHPIAPLVLPHLTNLLSKATITPRSPISPEQLLFDSFDYQVETSELPVAPLSALADGLNDIEQNHWLRADPVELRHDQVAVYLMGYQHLHISDEECQALVSTLNQHLAADDLQLIAATNARWYLRYTGDAPISEPLSRIVGKDILAYMPQVKIWCQRLTEIQMILFDHPVNIKRRQAGIAPVNSLWFWGAGQLPASQACPWQMLYTDDSLAQGMAQQHQLDYRPWPKHLDEVLANKPQGKQLLYSSALHADFIHGDVDEWQRRLEAYEQAIFTPLLAHLKAKTIRQLSLITDHERIELTYQQARKWWRKQKPMQHFIQ